MASQESPNVPALCVRGCGYWGNAMTAGMCSKCYREEQQAQEKAKAALAAAEAPAAQPAASALPAAASVPPSPVELAEPMPATSAAATATPSTEAAPASPAAEEGSSSKPLTRCQQCRKKVGLTGFKCKCGMLFCGQHRYAEAHNCSFDYKSAEREKLAANNPLVQASKVERI